MGNDSKYQHKNAKEKKTREPKKPGQDITITKLTQKSSMLGPGERNGQLLLEMMVFGCLLCIQYRWN